MKHFILCFFISFMNMCNAQNGSVTYSFVFNRDSFNIIQYEHQLYFNTTESTYYMGTNGQAPAKKKPLDPEVYDDREVVEIETRDTIPVVFYRNLKSNSFFANETAIVDNFKSKHFVYKDEGVMRLPWTLEDAYKNISGYECQKATIDFRGRSYEAWFTTEIPLPYGPWKLGGLPGLILEAYDLSKEVSFTVEKVTIPDPTASDKIGKPTNGEEITHKEYVAHYNSQSDKIRKAIHARMPKGSRIISSSSNIKKSSLELEYEWSKE